MIKRKTKLQKLEIEMNKSQKELNLMTGIYQKRLVVYRREYEKKRDAYENALREERKYE